MTMKNMGICAAAAAACIGSTASGVVATNPGKNQKLNAQKGQGQEASKDKKKVFYHKDSNRLLWTTQEGYENYDPNSWAARFGLDCSLGKNQGSFLVKYFYRKTVERESSCRFQIVNEQGYEELKLATWEGFFSFRRSGSVVLGKPKSGLRGQWTGGPLPAKFEGDYQSYKTFEYLPRSWAAFFMQKLFGYQQSWFWVVPKLAIWAALICVGIFSTAGADESSTQEGGEVENDEETDSESEGEDLENGSVRSSSVKSEI